MNESLDSSEGTLPLWYSNQIIPTFEMLKNNINTEICIIGGGITGLTTAYLLGESGKKVIVLEDGDIASGESGRTSAHLSNALDDRYYQLESIFGEQGAKYAAESHSEAINTIERIITNENINCDFQRVDGYLFLDQLDSLDNLKKEYKAAKRAGINVEYLQEHHIGQMNLGPHIRFFNQAKFHPVNYLAGLANAILSQGNRIYTKTHASELKLGKKLKIRTSDHFVVTADFLVIATNAPIFDKALIFSKQQANRTYIIGVEVDMNGLEDALFWDTGNPYHYIRFQKQGTKHIALIGGEDHRTGIQMNPDDIFNKLVTWGRNKIPSLGKVEYFWSGQIMEPVDCLAYIGFNPTDENNIFLATGDSGNGLTHGTIAGLLLRDQILGRNNAWWKIYSPIRKPIKNIPSLIKTNLIGLTSLTQYVTPGTVKSIEEVEPGKGEILREGASKTAVYRNKQGQLQKCSAVCTHMGGIVSWNLLEKSWDCPLHGSRFTPLGDVINAPANAKLEKKRQTKQIKKEKLKFTEAD